MDISSTKLATICWSQVYAVIIIIIILQYLDMQWILTLNWLFLVSIKQLHDASVIELELIQ